MIKRVIHFLFVISLFIAVCEVKAVIVWIDFFDGQVHEINSGNSTGEEEFVRVDYGYPGVGTTLNIVTDGKIAEDLSVFENGNVNLLGGEISKNLFASNNSQVTVSGNLSRLC